MSYNKQVLQSELLILMEKEREMKELYDEILKRLEEPGLHERISALRDDEKRHMGYVEIIMSMFEGENGEPTKKNFRTPS